MNQNFFFGHEFSHGRRYPGFISLYSKLLFLTAAAHAQVIHFPKTMRDILHPAQKARVGNFHDVTEK